MTKSNRNNPKIIIFYSRIDKRLMKALSNGLESTHPLYGIMIMRNIIRRMLDPTLIISQKCQEAYSRILNKFSQDPKFSY